MITTIAKKKEGEIYYDFTDSPFGKLLIASSKEAVLYIGFAEKQNDALQDMKSRFTESTFVRKQAKLHQEVLAYLKNPKKYSKNIPLSIAGTPFQVSCWRELLKVPFGKTIRYSELAKKVGKPSAVRAAASVVAKNPIAILIPCHRVVPSTGGIGKYHWGIKNKTNLLAWERSSK